MKKKTPPLVKLRRAAWSGLVFGWLIAFLFSICGGASMHLRSTSQRYWRAEQVEPFKQDCLSALASTPDVAKRFEAFCRHFKIATETAQEYMSFFAFFCFVVAGLGIVHAQFSHSVLKQMKPNGIHNNQVDASSNSRASASA
jgi:hypothetical protein